MSEEPWLRRLRRHWFGRYTIDDPRPIAATAPYTYFLPSENELLALVPGDLAKLCFRSHPPGFEWDAERMWVIIRSVDGERMTGTLDNYPSDMPQLSAGSPVSFKRSDIIDLDWSDERAVQPPPPPPRRTYWERCLVDDCVLDGATRVHFLYREEPNRGGPDDRYPDSGWRIRGDYRDVADEEIDARLKSYIALGKVLNEDDSWLHLIDEPIGSRFLRDWSTGTFVAED